MSTTQDRITLIDYSTDAEDGTSLSVTTNDRGWVEYASDYCKIYAAKSIPADIYEMYYNGMLGTYRETWPALPENIGLISHLETILEENDFVFPAFAIFDGIHPKLTCGSSRFSAHMSSGRDMSAFGLVLLSSVKIDRPDFVEIRTTQQFNDFYNLNDIDHRIKLTKVNQVISVVSSNLRHTFYNDRNPTETSLISRLETDIRDFWKKFTDEDTGRIRIKIHCLPEHRKFINETNIFDISYIDEVPGEWGFAFGKLLGAFKSDKGLGKKDVTLWLFDVTEPIDLELFLPLLNLTKTCIYAKNRKAVIFNGEFYAEFKLFGNIVK